MEYFIKTFFKRFLLNVKFTKCNLPGQGSTAIDRTNATPWEGRKVGLPPPGGSYQGSGDSASADIGPPEREYGRAIHCHATDSGTLRGDGAVRGDMGPPTMVVKTRDKCHAIFILPWHSRSSSSGRRPGSSPRVWRLPWTRSRAG